MSHHTTPNLKLVTPAQKALRTRLDGIIVDKEMVTKEWKSPPFQRPLRINEKIIMLAEEIKANGGILPGILTIGILNGEKYLLDGQHRIDAFLRSGREEGYADVRIALFDSLGEMGEEFVRLNSALVKFGPDDILRGLEASSEPLSKIRKKCSFIGYGHVRRGDKGPIVSMSAILRCWLAGNSETPSGSGISTAQIAEQLTLEIADEVVSFMSLAYEAWGRDKEYSRLWGTLNLSLAVWMYRRTVVAPQGRTPKLTRDQFRTCMMALSADSHYVDWLHGRQLGERERSPCYSRMKAVFAKRLEEMLGAKITLPQPAWCSNRGSGTKRAD